MRTVRVDVKVQSEKELKVVWNDESPWPAYIVHRKAIEDCAKQIRQVLHELVEAALAGGLQRAGTTLKELADRGAMLYKALFAALGNEAEAARIRGYYEQLEDPFRLRFCVPDSVYVPWGLVYAADPEALPDAPAAISWQDYSAFWCLGRQLTTAYERIAPDAAGRGQDAAALRMIRVIQPQAFRSAAGEMPEPELAFLDWLLQRHGEPLASSRELKKSWRDAGAKTGLLYFYCHANATRLALGEDEEIEASQLFLMLSGVERLPGSSGCLVLINGCSTAVGSPTGDFLLSASQPGLCGFVGTETDVPDVFALRFSLGLLDLLFREGLNLGDAMQRMYREHFPLSLLYGVYAHAGFRMPQADAPPPVATRQQNVSFAKVGTNRLGVDNGR